MSDQGYTELIARLRDVYNEDQGMKDQAADAIAALIAERGDEQTLARLYKEGIERLASERDALKKSDCTWGVDCGTWTTSCGQWFDINEEQTPSDCGMKFCCFCGGALIEDLGDSDE